MSSQRKVSMVEFEDGTVEVLIYPQRVKYEFESWEDARSALPDLEEM